MDPAGAEALRKRIEETVRVTGEPVVTSVANRVGSPALRRWLAYEEGARRGADELAAPHSKNAGTGASSRRSGERAPQGRGLRQRVLAAITPGAASMVRPSGRRSRSSSDLFPVNVVWSLIAACLVSALAAAAMAIMLIERGLSHPAIAVHTTAAAPRPSRPNVVPRPTAAVVARGVPVHIGAVAPYDPPPGDGLQNNAAVPRATDGKLATYWSTDWYTSPHFGNLTTGVGIVLEAAKPVRLGSLKVSSDTPGYRAVIKAGPSASGPFRVVSVEKTGMADTTFRLHVKLPERYYLVWITSLSPGKGPHYQTHLNEITAG